MLSESFTFPHIYDGVDPGAGPPENTGYPEGSLTARTCHIGYYCREREKHNVAANINHKDG